jgi:hypothetical protein
MVAALSLTSISGVFNRKQGTQILFGVWTLSGFREDFVGRTKLEVEG